METKIIQLHKGLGSGRVEIKEIVNVDMGYTIRVCNPKGIETQRFVVGDPEGDKQKEDAEYCIECKEVAGTNMMCSDCARYRTTNKEVAA